MGTNEPKPSALIHLHACPTLARGVRLQTDKSTGEPVLLFPEGVFHLNPTAHDIVSRCDGKRTVEAIISSLAEEYDAPADSLRDDILDYLCQLLERKLLIFSP